MHFCYRDLILFLSETGFSFQDKFLETSFFLDRRVVSFDVSIYFQYIKVFTDTQGLEGTRIVLTCQGFDSQASHFFYVFGLA